MKSLTDLHEQKATGQWKMGGLLAKGAAGGDAERVPEPFEPPGECVPVPLSLDLPPLETFFIP